MNLVLRSPSLWGLDYPSWAYYSGDTWQFWIGPKPPEDTPAGREALKEVRQIFQRSNKIRECVDRHVNGLVGQQFDFWFVDKLGDRNPSMAGQERLLANWLEWSNEQSSKVGQDAEPIWATVRDALVLGRGYLRIWNPSALSGLDSWEQYVLSRVKPGAIAIERDDDGFIKKISINESDGDVQEQTIDGRGWTVIRSAKSGDSVEIDLGGRFTVFELNLPSLITPEIKDAQNAINLALTMQSRTLVQNGFVERILTNAQLPGEWVDEPTAIGGKRFVANGEGLVVGPGRTAFIQGNPIYDEMGRISGYSNPGITHKDPASVESYQAVIAGLNESIYHSMGQGHLLAGETQISGVARKVLRQDAEIKSLQHARAVVGCIRSAIAVALKLNGIEAEPVVNLRLAASFLTPDEEQSVIAQYREGLLSERTAIAALSQVDDVDAEIALIAADKAAALERGAALAGLGEAPVSEAGAS